MVQEIGSEGVQDKPVDQGVQIVQPVSAVDGRGVEAGDAAQTTDAVRLHKEGEVSAMAGIDRLQGLALVNSQELLKVFSKHRKDNPGNVFRDKFFQPYFVLADTLTQDLGLQGVLAMLDTMGVDQDLQRINSGQFDFVSYVEQRLTAGHTLQDVVKEIDHLIDFIKVCVEAMKQETYNTERASKTLEILEIYKSAIESRIETTSQSKGS